jgi:hypothetical protein
MTNLKVQNMGTGAILEIKVTARATALDVKKSLEAIMKVPESAMRLFYSGHELHGNQALEDMHVVENSLLQLSLRSGNVSVAFHPRQTLPIFATHVEAIPELQPLPSISSAETEKLLDIYYLARLVKIITLVDLIFLMIWSFYSPWFLIGFMLATCGYLGASHYSAQFVTVYFMYQMAQIGVRIWFCVKYQSDTAFIVFTVLAIIVELWLAGVTWKLMRALVSLSNIEMDQLIELVRIEYAFWNSPTVFRVIEAPQSFSSSQSAVPKQQQPVFESRRQ